MKLSILIPVLIPRDTASYNKLYSELERQIGSNKDAVHNVEILSDVDYGLKKVGQKRNDLLERATGEYVVFIDADDMISKEYIEVLMAGILTAPDCISLRGIITTNGMRPEVFEHSLKYYAWATNHVGPVKYERYITPLNCIRASIAKRFKFPVTNWAEDHVYSRMLQASRLLKKEYYTDKILYYYLYKSRK